MVRRALGRRTLAILSLSVDESPSGQSVESSHLSSRLASGAPILNKRKGKERVARSSRPKREAKLKAVKEVLKPGEEGLSDAQFLPRKQCL